MKVNYNSLEEDWQLGSHWLCSWGGTPWKNCGSTGSTGLLDLRALCPSGTKVTKLVPDGTLDFLGNKILLCFTKTWFLEEVETPDNDFFMTWHLAT